MNTYETSAIVEDQGQVRVTGVPFKPGTQVEVIINPVETTDSTTAAPVADRADKLFAALDKARNVDPIGKFNRGETYDRNVLR
jgi:hypothetical protein